MVTRFISYPCTAIALIGAIAFTERAMVIRPELVGDTPRLVAVVATLFTLWLSAGVWTYLASR